MEKLIGKKFGRLKILEIVNIDGVHFARCLCNCGKIKLTNKLHVLKGHTKSCGCLHKELSSHRMINNNPVWMPGVKKRMMATNKRLGTRPLIRGGNGQEMPVPQRVLLTALGKGWYGEYAVPTKVKKILKIYPTCYKIDIANPIKMVGIEIDGGSHNLLKRKEQDKKKDSFLEGLGWKILRFKNEEVMSDLKLILSKI